MTRSIFWRVFWKEYRLQRALWIAMAILTTLMMLLVYEFKLSSDWPMTLFAIATGLPAMYLLGCGATLFAGEHEAETYEFQRLLPASAMRVFSAKIAFVIVSATALLGTMWLLAISFNGWALRPAPTANPLPILTILGFVGFEMFLWATLFSLLSKRVLVAAILGVVVASVSLHAIVLLANPPKSEMDAAMYWAAMPWRAAVAALVALVDLWLGIRWFREHRERGFRSAKPVAAVDARQQDTTFSRRFRGPDRMTIFGRLVWQHWRQSINMMVLIVVLIIFVIIPVSLAMVEVAGTMGGVNQFISRTALWEILIPASISLLGLCAFMADQRRKSYRFLADRGVRPGYIWLSRQLVTLVFPVFLIATLLFILFLLVWLSLGAVVLNRPLPGFFPRSTEHVYGFFQSVVVVLGIPAYLVLGITVGQLCSMFFRSSLLAGMFGLLLTALFAGWCELMSFWHISWFLSVLPIVLAMLLATRLRTPYWLLERNTLRAWVFPILTLAIPIIAILTAVPFYRIYSVPVIDPGVSAQEFARSMTPEEQATFDLYRQAARKLSLRRCVSPRQPKQTIALTVHEIAWVNDNPQTIELAIQASRGTLFNPASKSLSIMPWPFEECLFRLANLLICSATRLEEAGDLDTALEHCMAAIRISVHLRNWSVMPIRKHEFCVAHRHNATRIESLVYANLSSWAARPGQTPERLLAAARQIEQLTANASSITGIKLAHLRIQRFLSGDLDAISRAHYGNYVPPLTIFWLRFLPSERERAMRLLNLLTYRQIEALSRAEQAARDGKQIALPSEGFDPRTIGSSPPEVPEYCLQTQVRVPPIVFDERWGTVHAVLDYATIETSRRATCLALTLGAWKLEHGSLPKTLSEMFEGRVDRIPVAPCTGLPFRYCPEGVKSAQRRSLPGWEGEIDREIPANTPFLWATGLKSTDATNIVPEYQIRGRYGPSQPNSEYDLWFSGWPFPVP